MDKDMKHTERLEYYSVRKKDKVILCAATWMDLEIIILSEIRQRKANT